MPIVEWIFSRYFIMCSEAVLEVEIEIEAAVCDHINNNRSTWLRDGHWTIGGCWSRPRRRPRKTQPLLFDLIVQEVEWFRFQRWLDSTTLALLVPYVFVNGIWYWSFGWGDLQFGSNQWIQGITYVCTERIFASPQIVWNKIFLNKLL